MTTPAEAAQAVLRDDRWPDATRVKALADHERLANERHGCSPDASVIRYDDPEQEPMRA